MQLHARQAAQSRYIGFFFILDTGVRRLHFADAADKGRLLFVPGRYLIIPFTAAEFGVITLYIPGGLTFVDLVLGSHIGFRGSPVGFRILFFQGGVGLS